MIEAGLSKRGSGRKKLKKRMIASDDDDEPSETKPEQVIDD